MNGASGEYSHRHAEGMGTFKELKKQHREIQKNNLRHRNGIS